MKTIYIDKRDKENPLVLISKPAENVTITLENADAYEAENITSVDEKSIQKEPKRVFSLIDKRKLKQVS